MRSPCVEKKCVAKHDDKIRGIAELRPYGPNTVQGRTNNGQPKRQKNATEVVHIVLVAVPLHGHVCGNRKSACGVAKTVTIRLSAKPVNENHVCNAHRANALVLASEAVIVINARAMW